MKNQSCWPGASITIAMVLFVMMVFVASSDVEAEDFGYDGAEMADEIANMEIRVPQWDHSWFHTWVGSGTTFNGKAFVINTNTGQIYTWNLIETAAHNICDIPSNSQHYYKKFEHAQEAKFGFGNIPGESQHVSALVRFYSDKGSVWWRLKTEGCP
jgi:hypothetical protein